MSDESSKLLILASQISDGEPVDWEREEREAADESQRRHIRHLRLVEGVAGVHRRRDPESQATDPLGIAATIPVSSLRPGEGAALPEELPVSRWGHLEIREKLGEGAYGEVYRAWDENLDREVALKLLKAGAMESDLLAKAVLKEGRMLAQVRHPNVITVHGAETHAGRVGLWMEFVRGHTLAELVEEQGKFSAREASVIGLDLCRALAAVHGAGVVHRDIKPRNCMREEGGRILLMDFGAGQELRELDPSAGRSISGTPLYISPEVFLGQPADQRSDIYSLGVLLFHLVTLSYPVKGDSMRELKQEHQKQRARLLRDERADLPEAFVQVVERALAWDPERRFATAGQMEQALTVVLGVARPVAPAAAVRPDPSPPKPPVKRPAATVVLLGVLSAVVLVFLGWIGLSVFDPTERSIPVDASAQGEGPPSPEDATARTSGPAPSANGAYTAQASLFRGKGAQRERLNSATTLSVGDELSMEVRASRDLYVYIFNEDAKGNAFALFPLPSLDKQNPLPANQTHVLPGRRNGTWVRWQVDSAGDRERLIVLASPERLVEFEDEMMRLALPRPNAVAVPITGEAKVRLRGIGALVTAEEPTPSNSAGHLFTMAQRLAGQSERVEGVWLREIELANPAP